MVIPLNLFSKMFFPYIFCNSEIYGENTCMFGEKIPTAGFGFEINSIGSLNSCGVFGLENIAKMYIPL